MNEILKKIAYPSRVEAIDTLLQKHSKHFSFPFKELAKAIKENTNTENLAIQELFADYRSKEALTEGLSKEILVLSFFSPKSQGHCYLLLSFSAAQTLMKIFENKDDHEVLVHNEFMVTEYCKYLSTLILKSIKQIHVVKDLHLELSSKSLAKEDCLSLDLALSSLDMSVNIRLLFEEPLLQELQRSVKTKENVLEDSEELLQTPINLSTVLDTTLLTEKEISSLDVGDVILINTQFKPKEQKGTFTLQLENCPIAIARYKEGTIKILENTQNS